MENRRKLYICAGISKQEKHFRLLFAPPPCMSELWSSEQQTVGTKGFLQDPLEF